MSKIVTGVIGLFLGGWLGYYLTGFGLAAIGGDGPGAGLGAALFAGFIGAPVGALTGGILGFVYERRIRALYGDRKIPFNILLTILIVWLIAWLLMELFGGW